jgi:hypothetical protein
MARMNGFALFCILSDLDRYSVERKRRTKKRRTSSPMLELGSLDPVALPIAATPCTVGSGAPSDFLKAGRGRLWRRKESCRGTS